MNANISFLEIKSLVSRWAEEYAIDECEEMHFPVDSGRVQSTRGLKLYYERYAETIKARTGESVQRVAC